MDILRRAPDEAMLYGGGVAHRRVSFTPSLPMVDLLDQQTVRALLEEHGWVLTRGGKHSVKMERDGHRPITLPRHGGRTYGKGLSAAIRKQAGLGR